MRRTPLGIALAIAPLLAIAAIFVVPSASRWVVLVVGGALIAANIAHTFWQLRAYRRGAQSVVAAHPAQTALAMGLAAHEGSTAADRARVVAVVADAGGLSLRDSSDAEVLRVAADRILSIELGPMIPRRPRPVRVGLIDGPPLELWAGTDEDRLLDTVVALRTALGRAAG